MTTMVDGAVGAPAAAGGAGGVGVPSVRAQRSMDRSVQSWQKQQRWLQRLGYRVATEAAVAAEAAGMTHTTDKTETTESAAPSDDQQELGLAFQASERPNEGDCVILYESHLKLIPLKLKRGATFSNRYGNFPHESFLAAHYGAPVYSKKDQGYVIMLKNNPELWTNALTHRTQLNLLPGSVVLESGTGSGSLTTSLARAVAPHGHVHTFEFNPERARKALADFELIGISHLVTLRVRDICGLGFPVVEGGADAVFLDLPAPWLVVDSCKRTLKHQGRFCSFSPCIEQVQRTCLRLHELGFTEIRTVECLLRSYEVLDQQFAIPDISLPTAGAAARLSSPSASDQPQQQQQLQPSKKRKFGQMSSTESEGSSSSSSSATTTTSAAARRTTFTDCTRSYQQMRGHTGYLTFATCIHD